MTESKDADDQEVWRRELRRFWWSAAFFLVSLGVFATLAVIGLYH